MSDAVLHEDGALRKRAEEAGGIDLLYAWSNEWRVLPGVGIGDDDAHDVVDGKRGGFLEVREVIEAVLTTGYLGPWSYEVRRRS